MDVLVAVDVAFVRIPPDIRRKWHLPELLEHL